MTDDTNEKMTRLDRATDIGLCYAAWTWGILATVLIGINLYWGWPF